MKPLSQKIGLLTAGVWPRLAGAAVIIVALWAGFFWALS